MGGCGADRDREQAYRDDFGKTAGNAKRKESGKKREAKIVLVDGLIGTVRAN